jgi:hypothetical protein
VYLSDWYDTGECHTLAPDVSNGRIYRIEYRGTEAERHEGTKVHLGDLPSDALSALQFTENEWHARHARRILQERGPDHGVHAAMRRVLVSDREVTRRLRAMWVLHVTNGFNENLLLDLLRDAEPWVRAWAVRLLAEPRDVSEDVREALERLSAGEPSPLVRLHVASAAQRLPLGKRWTILRHLSSHVEDASDQNIPLMIWYATEPLVRADPRRARELAASTKLPRLREFIVRRMLDGANKSP